MIKKNNSNEPLFSIGVPTYNRKLFLKQTLGAILEQKFSDFEVIIGNDFTEEPLSLDMLGINDPRFILINHKENKGELENMNFLLSMAKGKYFTWQFDDDPCAPHFFSEVCSALTKYNYPLAVFSSFTSIYGCDVYQFKKNINIQTSLFSGRDFLQSYLAGRLKALGCCGFYNTDYLRRIGGVEKLTNGLMALHSEYFLLINAGLLPNIAYIDAPLVSTRIHENSWTCSNRDVELFKQAGIALIRRSIKILSNESIINDYKNNFSSVLKSVMSSVIVKCVTGNARSIKHDIDEYISQLEDEILFLKGTDIYDCALTSLIDARKNIPLYYIKAYLKRYIPLKQLKYVHLITSSFSKYMNKPF